MSKQIEVKFPMDFFGVEELGLAIKKVRVLRGLTQQELAMQTNTTTKFISNVENGKETAQLGKVLLLIRVLDMGTRLVDLRTTSVASSGNSRNPARGCAPPERAWLEGKANV
ncbi:MAG: helix-turn-helix domain-containing protein [Desulfovibrio sp.]|nr:helix-turn-helix domain-containing protein [Desulfovibrio sp.]